ncbi:uncharacterized protein PRD47_006138 isoform 1-T1 [Ara ararauna]
MQGEGRDQRARADTELPERTRVSLSSPAAGPCWGPVLGWGQRVSASPAAWCWRWVLALTRSHPGCVLQALVEEEPMGHLHTAVRQQAMLALARMSNVEMALGEQKESLLEACFRSVFLLPPKTDMQGLCNSLYFRVSAVVLSGALRAARWLPRAETKLEIQGTAGCQLCFPTLVPPSPSRGPRHVQCLWTGSSAHRSLSAPRPPLANQRWQGCPPLAWGVRSVPRERGTAERLTQPFSSLQTLDAMDILLKSLVLSSPGSRDLRIILQVQHWQRAGFAGAVPHPGGTGVSAVEWTVSLPASCTQHTAGRVLSSLGGPRHDPPCSSRSGVSLGCRARHFPSAASFCATAKPGPWHLWASSIPRAFLAPKQWEALTPLLRHRSSGCGCCPSSPASQSLLLFCPGLTEAETHWNLPLLHREPRPEALHSWLPGEPCAHSPIADASPPGRVLPRSPAIIERRHRPVLPGRAQKEADSTLGWHLPPFRATRTAWVQSGLELCCCCCCWRSTSSQGTAALPLLPDAAAFHRH